MKLFKNLSNAVSSVANTTVTVIDSTGKVITSLANSTTNLVDGLGESTSNLVSVSNSFTAELKADSQYNYAKNALLNNAKTEALNAVLADKKVLVKLQEAETKSLLADIFEDYDLTA